MGKIKLDGPDVYSVTPISNRFIDEFMLNANGEFVKIYLYLLRALAAPDYDVSICHIADIFNHTEKDVIRALKYWEQTGLLCLSMDDSDRLTNIHINEIESIRTDSTAPQERRSLMQDSPQTSAKNGLKSKNVAPAANSAESAGREQITPIPADIPPKHSYSANELDSFKEKTDVIEFLYLAQKYIGKPLSGSDTNTLLYLYDGLGFEAELIEYLIEYCVSNGHKSLRYMEKTALSWAEEGIDTVEKAKANTTLYNKSCYPVLKAFGLNGRNPGENEKALIIKWTNSYGFTMDIILDACNRTMKQIHQPSFEYADSILTKWKERGIRTMGDIQSLDEEHQKNKTLHPGRQYYSAKQPAPAASGTEGNGNLSKPASKNSFNNFTQRNYNYETLEKELLGNI
ncbi:MAG: DnaD domain protein [Lachnospiraceae bacterium]|nr:DnaD domain protein [Lachnospiraceae bacterium]